MDWLVSRKSPPERYESSEEHGSGSPRSSGQGGPGRSDYGTYGGYMQLGGLEWVISIVLFVPLFVSCYEASRSVFVLFLAIVPLFFWMLSEATWLMVALLVIVSIPKISVMDRSLLQALYIVSIPLVHHFEVLGSSRGPLGRLSLRSMALTAMVAVLALLASVVVSSPWNSYYGGSYVLLIIGLGLTAVLVYFLAEEREEVRPAVLMIRTNMPIGPSYSLELFGFYERGVAVRVVDSGRRINRILSFSIEWDGDPPDELIVTNGSYEKTLKKRGEMKGNGRRVFLYA